MREYICPCCGVKSMVDEEPEARPAISLDVCHTCSPEDTAALMSVHTIPVTTPICSLDARETFTALTETEKQYAYWIGRASWEGSLICLSQTSPESIPIFSMLLAVFNAQPVPELLARAEAAGFTAEEIAQAMVYCSSFFSNLGNYKSFGDVKFIPELPLSRFRAFLACSDFDAAMLEVLFDKCSARMYSLLPRHRQIGLGKDKGVSTYFSANCSEEDAALASRFLQSVKLSAYNTRLFKIPAKEGEDTHRYVVLVASAEQPVSHVVPTEHVFENIPFTIQFADHAHAMVEVVNCLRSARDYAANDTQREMISFYIDSFQYGSIDAHKQGSRAWIQDKGPTVESYIGFIESYRDPSGERAEWEGFVACVNKPASEKFQVLVDNAESLLPLMPWPKAFEKEKFFRPDFTSLDILAFGSSGVPAGINIPNYDDIRQNYGFKNVSLGNVLKAGYGASGGKPVSFIGDADQDIFKALMGEAFEVQVGIHELLGHGSGVLFVRGENDGVLAALEDPLTGEVGRLSCYEQGATWEGTFGKIASGYEECRAECCGIYLSLESSVLPIFGHSTPEKQADITYTNWLLMCRAGLVGLEFYTPETNSWRQAHMNARYVILRVLLEAGEGLVSIERRTGSDGKPDLEVRLDRAKVQTVGREAIRKFLLKLMVYKSTGNFAEGGAMFNAYGTVTPEMLEYRGIVMARKEPRRILLQPNMVQEAGSIVLKEYEETSAGVVASFVDRFRHVALSPLMEAFEKDQPFVDDFIAV